MEVRRIHQNDGMHIPETSYSLTKAEAAVRQVDAAIVALEGRLWEVATTLAGAAEDMTQREGFFQFHRDHLTLRGFDRQETIAALIQQRDWLKHGNSSHPDVMSFDRFTVAFMVARAVTKLEPKDCTPRITAFVEWWVAKNLADTQ